MLQLKLAEVNGINGSIDAQGSATSGSVCVELTADIPMLLSQSQVQR